MATATYPPPPPYYRLYKKYLEDPSSAPEPPPPIEGTYVLFGNTYTTDDVLPSLEEQGVRQLYPKGPNVDFKKELRSLNRELQLHLLELADILIERPSQYARRVEEISLIFKNLHHLLNSLRPHQARATLIHILELQIQRRKQAVEDIKRYNVSSILEDFNFVLEGSVRHVSVQQFHIATALTSNELTS
ncbi:OLC1v1025973C1 [Oldenlandia corymbosa var. corymbosa]|uniref:Mediator of RNA polymerase II transcription subunit 7 n=1 Tax=Oldenlandia corymbosa var. corymbosa TaxID=529605 RepID=A0AAV1C642_OLDCO|nr:OLC1v1025973C1 [Oldenlandia corymbosa var. corymbosa]